MRMQGEGIKPRRRVSGFNAWQMALLLGGARSYTQREQKTIGARG